MKAKTKKGIVDQLKVAKTPMMITKLLNRAAGYKEASQGTRNRWRNVATKRLAELATA